MLAYQIIVNEDDNTLTTYLGAEEPRLVPLHTDSERQRFSEPATMNDQRTRKDIIAA
jgi:hypothetical protein